MINPFVCPCVSHSPQAKLSGMKGGADVEVPKKGILHYGQKRAIPLVS